MSTTRINLDTRRKLLSLAFLPFVITAIERLLIKPSIAIFPLPETSLYLFKIGSITLLIMALAAFMGSDYGLSITKKANKYLSLMFLVLMATGYLFIYSLQLKGLMDSLAVIHLVNWIITVFREEFILRGIVQTESTPLLAGKFFAISTPIWFTTFIFSIWHLVNLTVWPGHVVLIQMLSCIPSGLILGTIREKTGNTLLTYLLHMSGDLLFFSLHTFLFGKLFFTLF